MFAGPAFDLPRLFLIDAAGGIRQQDEYGPATEKIFEREALFAALDSLLGAGFGAPAARQTVAGRPIPGRAALSITASR